MVGKQHVLVGESLPRHEDLDGPGAGLQRAGGARDGRGRGRRHHARHAADLTGIIIISSLFHKKNITSKESIKHLEHRSQFTTT